MENLKQGKSLIFVPKCKSSNWAHFYSKTVNGAFDIYKSSVIPGELGWNEEWNYGALNTGIGC